MNSIVIARFQEKIDWILELPSEFEIFLYNKGDKITDRNILEKVHHVIDRPNVGRESETYLYHILTQSKSNNDFTVFAQGDPFEHSPDFLSLLKHWRQWPDLQPLTWQWRSAYGVPPAYLLSEYEQYLDGRLRVRPERFSLATWGPMDFVDVGAQGTSRDYRALHGNLPEGTNVAAHFLSLCKLHELAQTASESTLGIFCYGAIFAAKNDRIAALPREGAQLMYQLTMGAAVYGYVLERLWLHFFGAEFELPRAVSATASRRH